MIEVAQDVFLGRGTAVNWVVLREGSDLTLIDAGYPRDADRVVASIEGIGNRLEDVVAVLVTHAHIDHIGGLAALLRRHPAPVFAHRFELPNLTGVSHEQATPAAVVRHSWRAPGRRWLAEIIRAGGAGKVSVDSALAFGSGGELDLPGRPTALLSGGHTSGHSAFLLRREGVLVTGDALVTGHPLSRVRGPQLLPAFFSHDPDAAERSLDVLASAPAGILVPGHGDQWAGDPAVAVEQARAALRR